MKPSSPEPRKVLQQHAEAQRARVTREVTSALGGETTPSALARAAVRAHAAIDDAGRRALARLPLLDAPAPACSAGCSYCCHVHVDATLPELLAIAEHLERTSTPEARGALEERLAQQVARVDPLTDEERWAAKIPCALLAEDGRCSIYEVRPLRCRAFHSSAVEPCREAFEGSLDAEPARIPILARAHDAAEEGYDRALLLAGLSAEGHRLERGLLLALGAFRGVG